MKCAGHEIIIPARNGHNGSQSFNRQSEKKPEHQMAFEEVRARLVAELVLACPDIET